MRALLAAGDMREFARLATGQIQALGYLGVQVAWSPEPGHEEFSGEVISGTFDALASHLLAGARPGQLREEPGNGGGFQGACLLADDSRQWAAITYRRQRVPPPAPQSRAQLQDVVDLLVLRCASLLQTERLRADLRRLGRAERVQRALIAICDAATSDRDAADVLHEMHQIVASLMYARNFFIVRYRQEPETMQFAYFADSLDRNRRDPDEVIDAATLENSLTLAMLRHGQPLHGHGNVLRERLHLPRSDRVGPASEDWLGVPMLEDGRVTGAVVVQSYDPAISYNAEDQALLAYLAQNIQTALARREAAVVLERRVAERTQALREEIAERQRAEHLQAAMFRIAEVAGGPGSMQTFYEAVHAIVGEFLDARNLYIGVLSEDATELQFPFVANMQVESFAPRPPGRGLSEYVLRTGQPLLLRDLATFERLRAAGEVEPMGVPSDCWLGVPLKIDDRSIGLIAVQSYSSGQVFTERDKELLSFVSRHIASALERRRTSESLRQANQQLEHASRTDPLTGLHNRRYLDNQIPIDLNFYERERERSGDGEQRLVFAIVDIDHFKRINDSYGHHAGDLVLQVFSNVLTGLVQTGDYVVRWGGEEFLLVFRPMHREAIAALGERIRRRVAERHFEVGAGLSLTLTCSIGLAEYPILGEGNGELGWERAVEMADAALYWVKEHGRNGWAILRPRPQASREALIASLRAGSQALIASPDLQVITAQDQTATRITN